MTAVAPAPAEQRDPTDGPAAPVVARLLTDQRFPGSPALRRLLAYLATATDADDVAALKEYAIGVDVFGRGAEFDPATDPIVRVQAHRLRIRLADWYAGPGRDDAVILTLPKGGYRLRTVRGTAVRDSLLGEVPHPFDRLIGRAAELEELRRAIDQNRLVTIIGAPGLGKTRLAIAAANAVRSRFADGARFVALETLDNPDRVPEAVLAAVGQAVEDRQLRTEDAARAMRDRQQLLVIDNAEHVVEVVAELARAILEHAPGMHLLVTSREPLRLFGELRFMPPPLATPPSGPVTPSELGQWPACALFVERASESGGGAPGDVESATAVADICRRLDGVPLGIELAASRSALLAPAALLAALERPLVLLARGQRRGPARHKTLEAALQWSYDLLTSDEQLMLRCLSVFTGSFDIELAHAATAGRLGNADRTFDLLASLVDKSLVATTPLGGGARFRLLETTRAFGARQRRPRGERATRMAMAHHLLARMERVYATFEVTPTRQFVGQIAPDLDNVRDTIAWAHGPGDEPELALALTSAAVQTMLEMGLVAEVRRLVARAVERISDATPPDVAANLLQCHGFRFTALIGSEAEVLARASALARHAGNPWLTARVLLVEIQALRVVAPERVEAQTAEALGLVEPLGPSKVLGMGLASRALTHAIAGRHAAARADSERSIRMLEQFDYRWGMPYAHVLALEAALMAGERDRALAAGKAAVATAERPGIRAMSALAASCLAGALIATGDTETGVAWARGALEDAVTVGESALVVSTLALVANGLLAAAPQSAAHLVGWCDETRRRLNLRTRPSEALARQALDRGLGSVFDAARLATLATEGAALSEAEAIALGRRWSLPTDAG